MPVCTIFGGPNGAGKSTVYRMVTLPGVFINADVIASTLNPANPDAASFLAGKEAVRLLDAQLLNRHDFAYETTLSSHQSINIMKRARLSGYRVGLVFVALDSADLHVERVANRVAKGGHDIPEATIRRRYDLSFDNLAKAVTLADETAIFNNTYTAGPKIILEIRDRKIVRNVLTPDLGFDQRIAASVATGLGIDAGAVFAAGRG